MASIEGLARRNLQSPSISTMNQNYRMNGKIILCALAILFFIVCIILLLHIYMKRLRRHSGIVSGRLQHSLFSQDTPLSGGLDKEIVEALPIFSYKSPYLSKATKLSEAVECAICLLDFRQNETCKLLPKCKHFFHTVCIDMWLLSNTTCPLCRTAADPNSDCGEVHDVGVAMACCFTDEDGGIELGEPIYQRVVPPTLGTRDDIACGNSKDDWERQRDTLSRGHFSLQSPATSRNYRRSKSEKFFQGTQGISSATNVSFMANHTHAAKCTNCACWKTGGRSFSHTTIDISKPQESFVDVSKCPAPPGSPKSCSMLRRPVANASHERGSPATSKLN